MTGHDRQILMTIIEEGESEYIEFKESLRETSEIIETVVAFANKNGGKIIIGVADDGRITGVKIGKGTLENLANNIINATEPPIYPSITVERIEDKEVIVVDIPSGVNKPYFYKGKSYVRVGKTNKVLSPGELREMLLKTTERPSWGDRVVIDFHLSELDTDTIKLFVEEVKKSKRAPIVETGDLEELMKKLNLVRDNKIKSAGILLFGINPQKYYPWAIIRAGRFKDELTIIDEAHIDGNLFQQISSALKFVMRNIKKTFKIDHKTGKRIDVWEYPLEALREAIVNALVHRDYDIRSPVYIKIYDDRLVITNPGGLIEPLTIEDLEKEHPSVLRNPNIANIFYLAGYIEKWGIGTLKMIDECKKQGLPPPKFSVEKGMFSVEFKKEYTLSQRETTALEYIK